MKKQVFIWVVSAAIFCGCVTAQKAESVPDQMQPEQIKSVMANVADWQLANPSKHPATNWTHGALFAGMTAWAQMAGDDRYYEALLDFGKKNDWQLGKLPYHADDHAVGQMYIEMYKKYKDPKMIQGVQERFDWILAHQPDTPLTHDNTEHQKRYNWCDALFMAPPVWAKLARITGQSKYLDYMNREWWATTDYLYDKDERLYFRDDRYFDKREANGKEVFWSRGNGWVFGGLVRVLEELPEDHPDRDKYITLYKDMAAKLVAIQPEEGLWHSSLLDPQNYPSKEASGSGFYCYGLAWGINHGLLDEKTYLPSVIKAWAGLVSCVHPDGKLGYVQPIGADPRRVTANQTEIYGVGAFLLAGSEVYKVSVRTAADVQMLIVTNPVQIFRNQETISLDLKDVRKTIKDITADNITVFDFKTNCLLVTQIVENEQNAQVLFQTNLAPGEKKFFWIMKQPETVKKPESEVTTFCRFVPERVDDFAWENDLIAFRVYGPAMWDDPVNSGVDCWLKRVPYPIINKWYGQMKKKSYHKDWGEGNDPYHVGKTTGCGGLRIIADGQLMNSNVYDSWKVIENGPIRTVFELTYDKSWKAYGKDMVETKRVTIDLGQRLCRFDCSFAGADADSIDTFAVGITTHDSKAKGFGDVSKGIAYCWEKIEDTHLGTGVLIVSPAAGDSETIASKEKDTSHIYLYADKTEAPAISYYLGYGWEKAGVITTMQSWRDYLSNYKERMDNPVRIQFAD
jgi:rhamnogalacturonyl hydrolase YesR